MKKLVAALFSLSLLMTQVEPAQAKLEYVIPTSLSQAVKTPVQACTAASPLQLPIITWGGYPHHLPNGIIVLPKKAASLIKKACSSNSSGRTCSPIKWLPT